MEAGRELDVLIANKVMGEKDDGNLNVWIPRYSIDIRAAWEVVEKLQGHLSFELKRAPDSAWFWAYFGDTTGGECRTAPLAICLAALEISSKRS